MGIDKSIFKYWVFFFCRFYMLVMKYLFKVLISFCNGGIVGIFFFFGKC